MDVDGIGIEAPPRNTAKVPLPQSSMIRKAANGRAALYIDGVACTEMRCSSSISQHVQTSSKFHTHRCNNREDWAAATDMLCWHCCAGFDTPPVAAPQAFDAATGSYVVVGNFCSLSCAKGYTLDNPTSESGLHITLLERMARDIYGIKHVTAAPPRLSLACFGGPYALEAFRAVDRSSFAVHRSPYVCSYMCVEERAQSHNLSAFPTASVGTVHGMRRPAQSQSAAPFDASLPCPYSDFVAAKRGASAPPTAAAPRTTTAPRTTAAPTAPVATRSGTLAQFMVPSARAK